MKAIVSLVFFTLIGCGGAAFTTEPFDDQDAGTAEAAVQEAAVPEATTPPEAGPDAPPETAPPECVTDLSNVGLADFTVAFTLTTTYIPAVDSYMALLTQRTTCDDAHPGWDVWMTSAGDLGIEVFDGLSGAYDYIAHDGRTINDGNGHHVTIARIESTTIDVSVDGDPRSYTGLSAMSLRALAPLIVGADPQCSGVKPIVGVLADMCISR